MLRSIIKDALGHPDSSESQSSAISHHLDNKCFILSAKFDNFTFSHTIFDLPYLFPLTYLICITLYLLTTSSRLTFLPIFVSLEHRSRSWPFSPSSLLYHSIRSGLIIHFNAFSPTLSPYPFVLLVFRNRLISALKTLND